MREQKTAGVALAAAVKKQIVRLMRVYAIRTSTVNLGHNVHIGLLTRLWAPRSLMVGDNCYIGKMCTIEVDGSIGSDCLIANNVGIVGRYDHDYRQIGTTIAKADWIGNANSRQQMDPAYADETVIGPDVWLGYGAIILSGISIGRGAIVAAGSVVVDDVQPYCIVAGNPARPVGERFSTDEIAAHERIQKFNG